MPIKSNPDHTRTVSIPNQTMRELVDGAQARVAAEARPTNRNVIARIALRPHAVAAHATDYAVLVARRAILGGDS